jgi:hypothetical protein
VTAIPATLAGTRVLLAARATGILAASCRMFGRRASGQPATALLPALYCADVADAIRDGGCEVRCYDVPADLSAPDLPLADDVGAVIWHHPFGLYLPPPASCGPTMLEDACFTLHTVLGMSRPPAPELMVFSPRKLFGWSDGGLAIGSRMADVAVSVPAADTGLAARWQALDLPRERARAAAASRHACARLGDRLPLAGAGEQVLTVLPLLASGRDAVIATLRASGISAWHWQRPMPGCTPETTPRAWSLWQRLLLVPVPEVDSPTYRLLASLPLESWRILPR